MILGRFISLEACVSITSFNVRLFCSKVSAWYCETMNCYRLCERSGEGYASGVGENILVCGSHDFATSLPSLC